MYRLFLDYHNNLWARLFCSPGKFLKHLCKKSLTLAWAQIQHVYLRKFSTFNLAKA